MDKRTCSPTQQQGQTAEDYACQWLSHQGLKYITRNFHCRYGEIDLIFLEAQTLVFVEVRSRKAGQFGNAAHSITYRKQQKIIAAARYFLYTQAQFATMACRFDVVTIDIHQQQWHSEWIRAAFLAE